MYNVFVEMWQIIISVCVTASTRAAMLSPPVLHFVILSLSSCLAYLFLSRFNQTLFKVKRKRNSIPFTLFSEVHLIFRYKTNQHFF